MESEHEESILFQIRIVLLRVTDSTTLRVKERTTRGRWYYANYFFV